MSLSTSNNNIAISTCASRHAEALEIKGLADHIGVMVSRKGVIWLYIPEDKREMARLYIKQRCKSVV